MLIFTAHSHVWETLCTFCFTWNLHVLGASCIHFYVVFDAFISVALPCIVTWYSHVFRVLCLQIHVVFVRVGDTLYAFVRGLCMFVGHFVCVFICGICMSGTRFVYVFTFVRGICMCVEHFVCKFQWYSHVWGALCMYFYVVFAFLRGTLYLILYGSRMPVGSLLHFLCCFHGCGALCTHFCVTFVCLGGYVWYGAAKWWLG